MNYLLGKDRDREHAKVLQGNPELTERLADNLEFKNRYTVGVLSFQESDLDETAKREIMASFEQSLFAGLDQDQYDITWIEHKDKDRLELNFVVPNVELTTGKRLQPYYDRIDRPLVENWKQVINHDYELSDPNDPRKAQAIKIDPHNLPKDIQSIKESIGAVITDRIDKGYITDRKGVIELLEQSGFEIKRTTDKSISIANPNGKRNIRLEGFIYENRRFGSELGAERTRTRQDYDRENTERYQSALGKLQRAITIKSESNTKSFRRPTSDYTAEPIQIGDHQQNYSNHISHNGSFDDRARAWQSVALQEVPRPNRVAGTDTGADRQITHTSQNTSQIEPIRERWLLLHSEQGQESGEFYQSERNSNNENQSQIGVFDRAKQLFERLQRLADRTRTAIRRLTNNDRQAERADNAINGSQSVFDRAERAITGANRQIDNTERQIKQREQQANDLVAEQQKALDRGKGFGFGR
ncbi:relaxase/mobilization nuclease domain-containing protein [Moraxella sp. Tifton1]|uniref:relaxase/mobilization nuclease domain-containing protein n=1 Tax=Moraxella oculi TaxID=2940516 RepID=UPI0020135112|nr:relaxase/mobilization nuclease domain-containing protein [Moraxella sp. Tifton1]MCL1624390.1 relaxase/mobilization nuclease domain-containing protein [Moraxella sp. Tifton1]